MKKDILLNAPLSSVIAEMGHTDSLTIADAGLPIPTTVPRIDLALRRGTPSFIDVFDTVAASMVIEKVLLAEEITSHNLEMHQSLLARIQTISGQQGSEIVIEYISHENFKRHTSDSRAIVRSGECTPYANIIIYSGVAF